MFSFLMIDRVDVISSHLAEKTWDAIDECDDDGDDN